MATTQKFQLRPVHARWQSTRRDFRALAPWLIGLLAACVAATAQAITLPPTVIKSFSPDHVSVGSTTQMTIALNNPNITTLTGAAFTDTYPVGMANAASGAVVSNNCGGTLTADPSGLSAALTGGSIPPNGCQVVLNVTGTLPGAGQPLVNHTGPITTNQTFPSSDATATLTIDPFTVEKSFNPPFVSVGGTTQMTITLGNHAASAVTGVKFSDLYPTGMANAPSGVVLKNTCGGTLTADPNGLSAALVGGTVPSGSVQFPSTCKIILNVTATPAGAGQLLTNHTGLVVNDQMFTVDDATAALSVTNAPLADAPIVTMTALPDSIKVGGIATMMIVLTNPNVQPIVGARFAINYPAPVHVVNAPGGTMLDDNFCITGTDSSGSGGDAFVSVVGATIPAGDSCVFFLYLTGTTPGDSELHTGPVFSANAAPGTDATATVSVVGGSLLSAPLVEMTFSPTSIRVGGTTQMAIKLINQDVANAVTGAQLAIPYGYIAGTGITNAADALVSNTCGGLLILHPHDGVSYDWHLFGATIPAGGSCSVIVNVVAVGGQGVGTYYTDPLMSGNAVIAGGAHAQLAITSGGLLGAPLASKTFDPVAVAVGETSLMTITLSQMNAFAITGIQFTDHYPDGMANAPAALGDPVVSNTCGGTVTADPDGGSAVLVNGTIPPGNPQGSCTVVIRVIGKQAGQWVNQTGSFPSGNALTGANAFGTLTVQGGATLAAPTVNKSFNPQSVPVGGTAQMTITLTNSDATRAVTGVQFTDPYPGGMANASSSVVASNTCSGTVTAPQDGLSTALSNGTIPPGGNCKVVVNVVGTSQANAVNHTGPVNSTNASPGADATATLSVGAVADLTLTKSHAGNFSFGQTGATYTLVAHNAGGAATNGIVTVTDVLPPSLTATAMNGAGWTCSVATTTCTRSDALSGGASYPPIALTVNVALNAPSSVTNTASVSGGGELNAANDSASDPTTIALAAPMVSKAFEPQTVTIGGTSQMSITLLNPNMFTAITGVQFADNYPPGMANAPSGVVVNNTCGGTVTAAPNGNSVTLTNGTIPPSQSCIIRINVVGMFTGSPVNHTGPVTSANANQGVDATATLAVTPGSLMPAPTMTKVFAPSSIVVGGSTQMTISLSNPNATDITGAQFMDHYPQGMTESIYGVLNNTCGGYIDEYPDAVALVNGTIPAQGSCSVIVQITGSAGSFANQTSPAPSANALTGGSASATLTVTPGVLLQAPTVAKAFAPTSITVGGTSQMTITLTNHDPNNALVGAQVFDSYPGPLHIANASGNPVVSNTCGGTVTAAPNAGLTVLGNGTIPANGSCSVVVNVVGTSAGSVNNHTGIVSSGNANDGADAGATLTVNNASLLSAPAVTKAFAPATVNVGGASQMTISLANGNSSAIVGAQFVDAYPTGMANAPNNAVVSNTCGGTPTADPNGTSATLVGGMIPANGSCAVVFNVIGTSAGAVDNHTGVVVSGNASTGADAHAILTVTAGGAAPDLTLTKSHIGTFSQGQNGATYSLLATNAGNAPTTAAVVVTDMLPASLTATAMSGPGWTCTLATTSCTRSDALAAGASFPAITLTVNVAANAPPSVTNTAAVSGGGETNTSNDTASDPTTIDAASAVADLTLSKSHVGNFSQGQTGASYLLTAHNVGSAATSGAVTVADTLPGSLTATAMSGAGWTCTLATTSCTRSDALAGGASYPAITLTVNVAANAPSSVTNVAGVSGGGEANAGNDAASDPTTIVSGSINHVPVAVGDAFQVTPNGTATMLDGGASSVLANDIDPDGDPLSATVVNGPSAGSLTLNANGTFNYHNTNANANNDSFQYKACDNGNPALCATATVTVTIGNGLPANHVPSATDDAIEVTPSATATTLVGGAGSVLANDVDPDPADALTATKLTDPGNGTVTLNADGTFSYHNTNANALSDSFEYEVCDDHGACDLGAVTITIGNSLNNHLPVVVDDAMQVAPNGTATTLVGGASSVLDNDSDPDAGDVLSAIKISGLLSSTGALAFAPDGTFSYHNTNPNAASDAFLYEACDPHGACTTGTVSITISNATQNHLPVAVGDAIQVAPNGTATLLVGGASSVLANDSDPDIGDTLLASQLSSPSNGTLAFSADGTFSYHNTNANATIDSFDYEVCDDHGACDAGVVTITIGNGLNNHLPVASGDAIQVAPNGTATILVGGASSVLGNDNDPDGDPLTAAIVSDPANGTFTLNSDGTFSYHNTNPNAAMDSLIYAACDNHGACTAATVAIAIGAAPPPATSIVAVSGSGQSAVINTAFAQPLVVLVTDASNNPVAGAGITFTPPANGAGATCLPAALTDATGHTQTSCTANASAGAYIVDATVNGTAINPAAFALTNTNGGSGTDHAPVAVGDALQVTPNGTATMLDGGASSLLANDIDPDGDPLSAAIVTGPVNGTLALNANGTFSYHNTNANAGSDSFQYEACDNGNPQLCTTATATITIGTGLPVNHVPFATDDAIQVAVNGTATTLVGGASSVLTNDVDADPADTLAATKLTDPGKGTITLNADGTFSYHNTDANATSDSFEYQVCDNHGACDLGVVAISIGSGSSDHPPIVVDDAIQVTPNGTATTLIGGAHSVLDNDSDPDAGDTLSAIKSGGLFSATGTLSFNTDGTFSYHNTNPNATSDSFLYEACDQLGACTLGIVSISITNAALDLPPIAMDDAIEVAPNGTATALVGDPNVPSSVLDNDSDPDAGDTLRAHVISVPSNGDITLNADGTFVYVNTNPATGADSWQYEACDGKGACVAATVSVTINAAAPSVSCTLPVQVDVVGDTVNLDLSLLFAPPPGQTLAYSVANPPPSLSIMGSLLAGTLDTAGTYTSTLQATTVPGGASANENVIFQVLPVGEILLRNGFDNSSQSQPCQ